MFLGVRYLLVLVQFILMLVLPVFLQEEVQSFDLMKSASAGKAAYLEGSHQNFASFLACTKDSIITQVFA